MKRAGKHSIYIIVLGVIVAICLIAGKFEPNKSVADVDNRDLLEKYKSTIPLVTTPLQILAKGLNIVTND